MVTVVARGVDIQLIEKLNENNTSTAKAIIRELNKFNDTLSIDVEMAIVRGRKALDFMLRNACELENIKAGTKPLERVIDDLKHGGYLPELIEKHCRVIKDFGNIAAHGLTSMDEEENF
jgi:hypothetical protein